jgi:hypothetical protein
VRETGRERGRRSVTGGRFWACGVFGRMEYNWDRVFCNATADSASLGTDFLRDSRISATLGESIWIRFVSGIGYSVA